MSRRNISGIRVLLVEDPGPLHNALVSALRTEGCEVGCADSEIAVANQLKTWIPNLVLVDLSVDDGSGLAICRRLKDISGLPIILVASPGSEATVLLGLGMGANDYLIRPLDITTITLRIAEVLGNTRSQRQSTGQRLVAGPVTIHTARRTVDIRGKEVHFPRLEYDLLLSLALRPGQIRTRNDLFDELWGRRPPDTTTLDGHIQRIRKKVEIDPHHPRHIITVRGIGFFFDPGDLE